MQPGFDLGNGLYGLSFLAILPSLNANCNRIHGEPVTAADLAPIDAFAPSATGINIVYLAAIAPTCMILTLALESGALRGRVEASIKALLAVFRGRVYSPGLSSDISINSAMRSERSPLLPRRSADQPETLVLGKSASASESAATAWLIADNVDKTYPGACTASVSALSLSVAAGEVVGLLGANGAGKTTLFRLLTGEAAPSAGVLRVCGRDIAAGGLSAGAIGFVPQADALVDHLTVGEHAELFARLRGVPAMRVSSVARAACTAVGISAFWGSSAHRLSGGTCRKLSLACALAGAPPVLLLDEFTSGVDAVSRRFLWGTVAGMRERLPMAILLSSVSD